MNRVNPKYVLRNHLAESRSGARRTRTFEVERLAQILRRPFDEQPNMNRMRHCRPTGPGRSK
jgi:uncharacterized protein YdiU (UPF0061 family)